MKKLLVLMMLLVLCNTGRAQIEETVVITTTKEGMHPQVVLDSIKKHFPEPVRQTLSILTTKAYGQQWNVEVNPDAEELTPLYYEVFVRTKNGNQTAIYDKSGKLLKLKQTIKNAELPEKVENALTARYSDWRVTGKEERLTNANEVEVTYKINLKKGVLRKTIFLDPDGNVKVALPV